MITGTKHCCTPSRDEPAGEVQPPMAGGAVIVIQDAVTCPGGTALVGTDTPVISIGGEGSLRRKKLRHFQMMATTDTNATFGSIVADTGYVSEAERLGWSIVFFADVVKTVTVTQGVVGTEWWRNVDGADWRHFNGPDTAHLGVPDHAVVQVSWKDSVGPAKWCDGRLPPEAEWEHAARDGLSEVRFSWENAEPDDDNAFPCNIWQGQFPRHNIGADGRRSTALAQSFALDGYALYNMVGNVREWTKEPFRVISLRRIVARKMGEKRGFQLLKGGSYLCHRNYLNHHMIAARTGNSPDTATPHQGFRVDWNIP